MNGALHYGIMLQIALPTRQQLTVFDGILGRIDATLKQVNSSRALIRGGLVQYEIEHKRDRFFLKQLELVQLPARWVTDDVLFLHHVLELALFFIPVRARGTSTFTFLTHLYEPVPLETDLLLYKQLFICRFFASLGIYPQDALKKDLRILFYLLTAPTLLIEEIVAIEQVQHKLAVWLTSCVRMHPHANTFKTMHFLIRAST